MINLPAVEPTRSSVVAEPTAAGFTLGSASPRRADLLRSANLSFDIETVDIDERALLGPGETDPRVIVERIAHAKFNAFGDAPRGHGLLLTADTLVACRGAVMGKPDSSEHLAAMLGQMSGSELHVASAVCVGPRVGRPALEVVSTVVSLHELTSADIDRYVMTGAGLDKAGGLALQAQAKPFIRSVRGCWSNVLGLPLCAALRLLGVTRDGAPAECSVGLCGSYDG